MIHINFAIIGDHDTGKSTFVHRHITGEFIKDYTPPELGQPQCHTTTLEHHANHGDCTIKFFDFNGCNCNQANTLGGEIIHVCLAFVTKDSNHELTFSALNSFVQKFPRCIPVVCWSKCDLAAEIGAFKKYEWHTVSNAAMNGKVMIFPVSSKSNYNYITVLEKPIAKVFGIDDLRLS